MLTIKLKPVEAIGATEKEFELEGDIPSPSSSNIKATQLVPELVYGDIENDYDGYVLKRYKPNITGFYNGDFECSFKESYTLEELKEKFGVMFKEDGGTYGIISCGKLSVEVYIDLYNEDPVNPGKYYIDLYVYLDYPDNNIEYNYYLSNVEGDYSGWSKYNQDTGEYDDCEAPKISPSLLNMDFEDYSVSGCFAIPSQIGFFLISPFSQKGADWPVYQSSDTSYGWFPQGSEPEPTSSFPKVMTLITEGSSVFDISWSSSFDLEEVYNYFIDQKNSGKHQYPMFNFVNLYHGNAENIYYDDFKVKSIQLNSYNGNLRFFISYGNDNATYELSSDGNWSLIQ